MKKILTKIVGAVLGFAMAIGVGAGIVGSKKADPVYASTGSYTLTFDANDKADGSGNSLTSDGSTALTTGNMFTNATYSFTVSKVKYYWIVDGCTNIASVSSTANCYPGRNSTMKVGKSSADGTIAFTVAGESNLSITSVSITAFGSANTAKITIDEATEGTKQWTLSTTSGSHTFTYGSAVKTVTLTGGAGLGSSNKVAYISQIVINYSIDEGAPTPTYTVTYDANDGSGTMTDSNSPYDSGDTVTVLDNEFTRDGYTFAGFNTAANGSGASYDEGDTFNISANTTLYAQWEEIIITEGTTDTLNYSFTGITGTGYKSWDNKTGTSGAVYAGQSNAGVEYIQLRNTSPSGIITKLSGGIAKSITVTWASDNVNDRSLTIFGKHSAYSEAADLYDGEKAGTSAGTITFKTGASSAAKNLTGDYEYIGIKAGGAMYMSSIAIVWQSIAGTIIGNNSVDAGTQWSGSVTKDADGSAVAGVTYAFAASNGAVISASDTENGTFISTSAGTVTVSATKDGYVIASKVVTVNAVLTPTLILSVESVSGYIDEAFSITATFANLTSAFSWGTPSGTGTISGSVTASSGNSTDGSSTYSGTLTGAGTVTLSASGGGVDSKAVTFTITRDDRWDTEFSTTMVADIVLPDGGEETNDKYYVVAQITSITDVTRGHGSAIDKDGTEFNIYFMYNYNGTVGYNSLTAEEKPVVDDFVVLYGVFCEYASAPEIKNAWVVQRNGTVFQAPELTGVSLNKTSLLLGVGYDFTLEASPLPNDAELGDITWTSSNGEIASVNASGVVTGVAAGSATITATAGGFTANCSVTVTLMDTMEYSGATTNMTASGNATTVGLDSSLFSVDADKGGNANFPGLNAAGDIRLYASSGNGNSVKVSINPAYTITTIKIDYKQNPSNASVYADYSLVAGDAGAYSINKASFTIKNTGASGQLQINSIDIAYREATSKELVERNVTSKDTVSALKFNYTNIEDSYTYTNTAIRFGGAISKALWDQLEEESDIQGYGVLVAETSNLGGKTIVERYNEARPGAASVNAAITSICSTYSIGKKIVTAKEHPTVMTSAERSFLGISVAGDHYIWTATKSFSDSEFTKSFNSVAFILIDGDIVFLQEESITPKAIAIRDLDAHGEDPAAGALEFIKVSF